MDARGGSHDWPLGIAELLRNFHLRPHRAAGPVRSPLKRRGAAKPITRWIIKPAAARDVADDSIVADARVVILPIVRTLWGKTGVREL